MNDESDYNYLNVIEYYDGQYIYYVFWSSHKWEASDARGRESEFLMFAISSLIHISWIHTQTQKFTAICMCLCEYSDDAL